jgi:hypothetical protein
MTANRRTHFGTPNAHVSSEETKRMLAILAVILLVAWLLGLTAFHVAGGFIHLLLIVAAISLVMHFVRGRTAV